MNASVHLWSHWGYALKLHRDRLCSNWLWHKMNSQSLIGLPTNPSVTKCTDHLVVMIHQYCTCFFTFIKYIFFFLNNHALQPLMTLNHNITHFHCTQTLIQNGWMHLTETTDHGRWGDNPMLKIWTSFHIMMYDKDMFVLLHFTGL